MISVQSIIRSVDWYLFSIIFIIISLGVLTVFPGVDAESLDIFYKHLVFSLLSLIVIPFFAAIDYSFLNGKGVSFLLYIVSILLLAGLNFFGPEINNATSWFIIFGFSIQPVDFIKIALIIILARYFATRHVNIQHFRTLITSGLFLLPIVLLVYLQPDLGSATVLVTIWLVIIITSGIPIRYFLALSAMFLVVASLSWVFLLQDFQKERIVSFLSPQSDLTGIGYNAFQSKVAIGSGELFGKGVAEGTQSKLLFLPEYQSDFVFAAFAEEWGFVGVALLFSLFIILLLRLIHFSLKGRTNFETLFIIGVVASFFSHIFIHMSVNVGLLPVTGITLPLMSHGGSHLISEYIMLGMAMSMYRRRRWSRKSDVHDDVSSFI